MAEDSYIKHGTAARGTTSPGDFQTAPTRILLRGQSSGEYFAGNGQWTKRREDAMTFETSTQAVYLVIQQRLLGVELLLTCQDIPYEIHLPVSLPVYPFAPKGSARCMLS